VAFYDALAAHGDVRQVMGDKVLAEIAHHLVEVIRASVTIDWTRKESVRAGMRKRIKRLLREHGYPPEKAAEAADTVIQQAEQVCRERGMAA
jgi:type I restriction enzyme R subunit